jgi:hypothetical protein
MDWNTEVAADWPGTDGREFVHGFTHEFDTSGKTLSTFQDDSPGWGTLSGQRRKLSTVPLFSSHGKLLGE